MSRPSGIRLRALVCALSPCALLIACGSGPLVIDAREDAGAAASDAAPSDAAAPDGAMDPDGGCAPPSLPAWAPIDTMGPDGEGVIACTMRVGAQTDDRLPVDQAYDLTTFGGPGDEQPVSCPGAMDADGSWWYAANAQRFSCGQRVRVVDEARARCVIVEVADVGPNACVEEAGQKPIWDVSPLASMHLFGQDSAGWSERLGVFGAPVGRDNPLGPCDATLASPSRFLEGFIGGACASGADCDGRTCMTEAEGWPGGACTEPCETSCPDRSGANAFTACVDLEGARRCLARCDFTLFATGCRPGYGCARHPHPTGAGADRWVCTPAECR
ncbi:MAG: hypothetical protein RLO52_23170 [Sandaracinaceae bacterium]